MFEAHTKSSKDAQAHKVISLEEKPVRKNEVLSELLEKYVELKKELGDV